MSYYNDNDYRDYLAHHGILGQRWGKRNGPPYPLGYGDHSASEKRAGWRDSLKKNDKKDYASRRKELISDLKKYAKGNTKAIPKQIDEILSSEAATNVIDAQKRILKKEQELWNNEKIRKPVEDEVASELMKTGRYKNVAEAIYENNHHFDEKVVNRLSDRYAKKEYDDYSSARDKYIEYASKEIKSVLSIQKNDKIKPAWSNNALTAAQWCNGWLYDWNWFYEKAFEDYEKDH